MISTSTVKYNPSFLSSEQLIRNFVVRQKDLDLIVELIRENVTAGNQHLLVLAPRGAGKTTLVLRGAAEVGMHKDLSEKWYPVIFPEESYEVCSPGEFWLEALFHIGEQTGEERWKKAYHELRSESDENRLRERALAQVLDFADEQKKRLLLIVENLNMLLGDQISDDDAWKLRYTFLNEPRIMILATAVSTFEQLENSGKAMFELFKIHTLEPLDTKECGQLWESITGENPGWNRIRPIQILTGGSPRLLVIISGFAVKSSFRELMENLAGLVDDHTEYFKSHLDTLPAQERKVFVTLADKWNPATAREVADASRISVNKVSAHLNRLVEKGAVVVVEQKSRKKWYQIAERMYNIYHLMRRRGDASNRVRAVVDFIVHFYTDEKELVTLVGKVAEEACEYGQQDRNDHLAFLEEVLKSPHTERVHDKILATLPDTLIESLSLPQFLQKHLIDIVPKIKGRHKGLTQKEIETGVLEKPDDPRTLAELTLELLENHPDRVEEAKATCKRLIALVPDRSEPWVILGTILRVFERDFQQAEQAYRKAIEIDPKNIPAWNNLGILFDKELGKFRDAEQAYKKAIEIDPKFFSVWNNLGILFSREPARYDDAEKAYRKAVEIEPKNSSIWLNLGKFLDESLARYDDAEHAYRKAIEIDPQNADIWFNLGHLFSNKLARYEDAERAYRKAIKIDPKSGVLWMSVGILLHQELGRYDDAEQAYRKAIEIDPQFALAWYGLGTLLHTGLHKPQEAEHAYEKAVELEPSASIFWMDLIGLQLKSMSDKKKALKTADRYLNTSERSAESLNNLARFFFAKDYDAHFDKAEEWCREAVAKEKDNPHYQLTLAVVLGGMGKWDESLNIARQFTGDKEFVQNEIRDIIEYYISAAGEGHAADALAVLEQHSDIPSLEPLIAGLKLYLGQKVLTAQEILEIGQDIAKRIRGLKISLSHE